MAGAALWLIPVLALMGVWLLQVFTSGGYLPRQWLPAGIIVATMAVVLFGLGAFPGVPGRISLLVAGGLGAHTVWMIATAMWAPSDAGVWMAAGRMATYALVFVVAVTMFQAESGRAGLRYGLVAAAAVLIAACVGRLLTAPDMAGLFVEDRLAYPVAYPNNAAALYLIPFWPLLWVAADRSEKWYLRGPVLGLGTALLMLAFLTQSRGGFWAFALSAVAFFVLSPARLRTLAHLVVVLAMTALAYPSLNRYWAEGPAAVGHSPILTKLIPCVAAAVVVGWVIALLEPRLRITNRGRTVAGVVAVVLLLGGALGGLAMTGGGLRPSLDAVGSQWGRFIDDLRGLAPDDAPSTIGPESTNPSRFLIPGSSGRWDLWRVAWLDFEAAPVVGVGAGNYVFTYNRDRARDRYAHDAHSLPLGTLAETGLVGGLLLFGTLGLAMGAILTPRAAAGLRTARRLLRRGPPPPAGASATAHRETNPRLLDRDTAWAMALVAAVIFWLFHASVDWLWEMTAVTIPAMLYLALALSQTNRGDASKPGRFGWYRWTITGLAGLILIALSLPYVALKYNDMAVANAPTDPALARRQARVAAALAPANPEPLLVQQQLYRATADSTADPGAKLDNLALALDAAERATGRDPANWVVLLAAAEAAERLANAVEASTGQTAAPPGKSPDSLADNARAESTAAHYRGLTPRELRELARAYAERAGRWNPKEGGTATPAPGAQIPAPPANCNTASITSDTSWSLMELKMGRETSRRYSS